MVVVQGLPVSLSALEYRLLGGSENTLRGYESYDCVRQQE